ncbi:beta-ketoacyl-[acyl-carrier-protein] synthase family protein [endosymbiont of Ridgeia piscesae]|nr:beta-ketoacyl-[acyl-carrier-protein] synthase family protein [endosymbiont of Ridgeia piscesae]
MMRRVLITGLGVVSPLGNDIGSLSASLRSGASGIHRLRRIDTADLKVQIGAEVDDAVFADPDSDLNYSHLDRFSKFAVKAAAEALLDSKLPPEAFERMAAIIGTGCGGKETDEETYCRLYKEGKLRAHPITIPKGMPSAAASQVSMQFGIRGPVFCVTSACSSSAHAIAQGVMMIRSGIADVVIAGGTDAPFTFGLLKAWEALRVLSRDTCRPFSEDRSGLVLGEGAGMLVLESESHALARGAQVHAELAGIGMSSDASHITDPSVDGAVRAMRLCLQDAGVSADQVDYINAHGTATKANDVSETAAIRKVFGAHAEKLRVSSTKSMHGHALGAAGGIELVSTVLAMQQGFVPPTTNFTRPGEGCDLDYVVNAAEPMEFDLALSNSFAFGGLNAVLAVRRFQN